MINTLFGDGLEKCSQHQPFSSLSPDFILNALEEVGLRVDGRLLALNSYENRVYQVGIDSSDPVVVKFYRPDRWSDAGILEEHSFLSELATAELPVVGPRSLNGGNSLHHKGGFRFAVFPRQGGRVPEVFEAATLERIGRLLARVHAVGALRSYNERPSLTINEFGVEASTYLVGTRVIPHYLKDAYISVVEEVLQLTRECFRRAGNYRGIRLHGDCYPGNILWTNNGPHFVDFDDSRTGPAVQDLWMFLSGDRLEQARQLGDLLRGYSDFFEFNLKELHLIEALRSLRMIHFTAWLARRWSDPAFPPAFPWFHSDGYWQQHIDGLREQILFMNERSLEIY